MTEIAEKMGFGIQLSGFRVQGWGFSVQGVPRGRRMR